MRVCDERYSALAEKRDAFEALTGTAADVDAGITSVTGDAILGYNTTGNDGSHHLRIVPASGPGVVTVTFTPTLKLQAWGAYFTGIGTVPNTSVELSFDDGSAQTFGIPGNESGGASFFGFTDPGKLISSVTVRETLTSSDLRDIFSIDDIRYASSSEEVGSMLPWRFTRTEGIWPIGVSKVLGWHPAGSLE